MNTNVAALSTVPPHSLQGAVLKRAGRCATAAAVLGLTLLAGLLACRIAQAQGLSQVSDGMGQRAEAASTRIRLPQETEQIDAALARVEAHLAEVRQLSATPKATRPAGDPSVGAGATLDEWSEREQLLQQWVIALDQQARHLRSLREIRRLNQEHVTEQESWRGLTQPATLVMAEQLTDNLSTRRLELRTAQMYLSILEGEIARYSTRVNKSHRELRLAKEAKEAAGPGAPPAARRQWLAQLAQLRNQADEASLETAEVGRLVMWEACDGRRKHIEFLERMLGIVRKQARITKPDLDSVLAQINDKRIALRKDMNDAIARDQELRGARDAAVNLLRGAPPENVKELSAAAEVAKARVETSAQKVESVRGFLQLTEYAQSVWEDRLWAIEPRSLTQLRAKQRHYQHFLAEMQQWKRLMEQALSAVSDQVLRQVLRADDSRLPAVEREAAWEIHGALQERVGIQLRAVGAVVFTEDLISRLHSELSEQIAGISMAGRVRAVLDEVSAALGRLWNTELYIAEDSIIAGGQKVSIPRSITLGKVIIALTIFAFGLMLARWAYQLRRRWSARRSNEEPSADVTAKALAASFALLSLLVAMASVRIPWTVFAFMGGALAIGVGFGAQTLINNFISGIILLCERSIRVGDIIEVDDQRGKIVRVGLRNSLVARGDGIEVLVPNSQFLEKKVVNWTLSDDLVRYEVEVGVAYGSPLGRVAELIAQAAAEHPHVIKKPAPDVLLEEFGDSTVVFTLEFWMHLTPKVGGGRVRSDLRHRIKELFDADGIIIANPQRDLHLDSSRPLEIRVINGATAREAERPRPRSTSTRTHPNIHRVIPESNPANMRCHPSSVAAEGTRL